MSLSNLLFEKATRDEARKLLDPFLPDYRRTVISGEPSVPRRCAHPALVGTAFDYAARLELNHLAPHAVDFGWIAEEAVSGSAQLDRRRRELQAKVAKHGVVHDGGVFGRARQIVKEARDAEARGWPDETAERYPQIARHSARLAQLDPAVRSTYPPTFGEADGVDENGIVAEVIELLGPGARLWELTSRDPLLLNPSFEEPNIGGADADLIAGDVLVEIKTVQNARVERDFMRQLVGYVALAAVSGQTIREVAVYFPRFGVLNAVSLPNLERDELVSAAHQLSALWQRQRGGETVRLRSVGGKKRALVRST